MTHTQIKYSEFVKRVRTRIEQHLDNYICYAIRNVAVELAMHGDMSAGHHAAALRATVKHWLRKEQKLREVSTEQARILFRLLYHTALTGAVKENWLALEEKWLSSITEREGRIILLQRVVDLHQRREDRGSIRDGKH